MHTVEGVMDNRGVIVWEPRGYARWRRGRPQAQPVSGWRVLLLAFTTVSQPPGDGPTILVPGGYMARLDRAIGMREDSPAWIEGLRDVNGIFQICLCGLAMCSSAAQASRVLDGLEMFKSLAWVGVRLTAMEFCVHAQQAFDRLKPWQQAERVKSKLVYDLMNMGHTQFFDYLKNVVRTTWPALLGELREGRYRRTGAS